MPSDNTVYKFQVAPEKCCGVEATQIKEEGKPLLFICPACGSKWEPLVLQSTKVITQWKIEKQVVYNLEEFMADMLKEEVKPLADPIVLQLDFPHDDIIK